MQEDFFEISRLKELTDILKKYNYYYYDLANPLISDTEYDKLYKELLGLEKKYPELIDQNSPTKKIGEIFLNKNIKKEKHLIPMISLSNSYNENDILDWDKRIKKILIEYSKNLSNQINFSENNQKYLSYENNFIQKNLEYIIEPKIDGIGLSCIYKNRKLEKCLTRGDGIFGEDITKQILAIEKIPTFINSTDIFIPEILEIRGEIYMDNDSFKNLNKEKLENNKELFANSRNATAGTIKNLNINIIKKRNLNIFFYALGFIKDDTNIFNKNIKTQFEFLNFLKKLNFPVNPEIKKFINITNVIDYAINFIHKRENLNYEIDGIVIKVNSFFLQKILGETIKFPRWAIAYKFPAKQGTTFIKNIIVQVGRTGILTPVAEVEPIKLGGVIIKRATLHNFDEIKRLNIKIGSKVLIERSGDVIPKIIKTIQDENLTNDFIIPKKCPICGTEIIKFDDEVAYRCPNSISCKAQIIKSLELFASNKGFNIIGFGENIITEIIEKNLINNIFDIFNLQKNDFLKLNLFAEKKAQNILTEIQKSKNIELKNFIFALGIHHVGEKASRILSENFLDLETIFNLDFETIKNIKDFGDIIAKSIINFISNNKKILDKINEIGIIIKNSDFNKKINNQNWFGYNKKFVITGTFKNITRENLKKIIEKKGGIVINSVSKNTDFLILGENEKISKKLSDAIKFNIKIIKDLNCFFLFL